MCAYLFLSVLVHACCKAKPCSLERSSNRVCRVVVGRWCVRERGEALGDLPNLYHTEDSEENTEGVKDRVTQLESLATV